MNSKQAIDRIMKVLGLGSQKFYEAKTDQGVPVKIDGDLEIGAPIYVSTEEGMIPAPPGTHKLDDGSEIEVDEAGKVSKIKMGDMEMEKTEDAKLEEKKEEESMKKFVEAKSYDGATLESPTFDVGEDIYVVKDGEKEKAPNGEHQIILKDSEGEDVKIRVMVTDGKITQRENVEEEEEMMTAEQIAQLFSLALKKLENKIDEISNKQIELEGSFQKFSMEPAGEKVYNQKTIKEETSVVTKAEQFRRLKEAMSHKK